jgi:hypothetical protein
MKWRKEDGTGREEHPPMHFDAIALKKYSPTLTNSPVMIYSIS